MKGSWGLTGSWRLVSGQSVPGSWDSSGSLWRRGPSENQRSRDGVTLRNRQALWPSRGLST